MTEIEREAGLTDEICGWLCLEWPSMAEKLEKSRQLGDPHRHRKLVNQIVGGYAKEHAGCLEWSGSTIGRTIRIVQGQAKGADEIGLGELELAMRLPDAEAKTVILALMQTKKILGGTLKEIA